MHYFSSQFSLLLAIQSCKMKNFIMQQCQKLRRKQFKLFQNNFETVWNCFVLAKKRSGRQYADSFTF